MFNDPKAAQKKNEGGWAPMLDITAGHLMVFLIAIAVASMFAVAWYVWGRD